MTKVKILLATLMILAGCASQDIRDRVTISQQSVLNPTLDPDNSIFGIPFGTSEDAFIDLAGKPTGYIHLSPSKTAMLYGKKHLFVFYSKKLSGLRISSGSILDWKTTNLMSEVTAFDRIGWKLNNGIEENMNRAEVKNILGSSLLQGDFGHPQYYITDKAQVEIEFMHHTNKGEGDDAFFVYDIYIRRK